ncbi:MAG: diguanylate cyclase, partial [Gemmatimonadaceae bacterium]|nr:diguanylate cyclase [Acetobacteraceae bacterium]
MAIAWGTGAGQIGRWFRQLSPSRRRVSRFGALLVAACLAMSGLAIWQLAQDAKQAARAGAQMLGTVIAEQTERSFQSVDLILLDILSDLRALDMPGARGTQALHRLLLRRAGDLPQAVALIVIGPDGLIQNSSRSWPTPAMDVSERSYFQTLRAGPSAAAIFSEPVQTRSGHGMVFYMARRIEGPDGQFEGVLHASIKLQHLEEFYRKIAMPDGFAVSLIRTDGTLLMRYPPLPEQLGRRLPDLGPWRTALAAGGGGFSDIGWDGLQRFKSLHPLTGFSAMVMASVADSAAYMQWRGRVVWILLATVAAVGGLLLMFTALMKELARHEASQMALRMSEQALAEKTHLLETTLDHMDQGLLMVSPHGTVEVYNRRAIELLGLPPEMMRARPAFQEVLTYQQHVQNEFVSCLNGGPLPVFCGQSESRASYERVRPDGTCLEVTSVPLNGGGMVRTFTDTTARKLAERRLAHYAFHDDLTQLCNRVRIHERLDQSIVDARQAGAGLAVLYLDLDRFKLVNDTRGHAIGDLLLVEAATRMRGVLREGDTVGRLGGDEFAVVFPGVATA